MFSVLWDVMVVKKFTHLCKKECEGGGDNKLVLKSELEGGFSTKEKGVCNGEQDVMVWKRQ